MLFFVLVTLEMDGWIESNFNAWVVSEVGFSFSSLIFDINNGLHFRLSYPEERSPTHSGRRIVKSMSL